MRWIALCAAVLLALSQVATAEPITDLLPPGAKVVVQQEADLTGDGVPDVIVGYTLPRAGLPPTEGRSAVLERQTTGGLRRVDLPGIWPGHYPPRFTIRDMTGDGRPELVRQVAGGGSWETLTIFQRQPDGTYRTLLDDPATYHRIGDTDGDGVPEVWGKKRFCDGARPCLQIFRWVSGQYVATTVPLAPLPVCE